MKLFTIIFVFGLILIYLTGIIARRFNENYRILKNAESIGDLIFINLNYGYSTKIQFENYYVFLGCCCFSLMFLVSDGFQLRILFLMIGFIGFIYMISISPNKRFRFYDEYFEITSPLNPFFVNKRIQYHKIAKFDLKCGLYNFHKLTLFFISGKRLKVEFNPANHFNDEKIINIILKDRINYVA